MWVQVLVEPVWGPKLPTSVVPTTTYGELHSGSSQVPIYLRNLSVYLNMIPVKVIIRRVTPANQVPLVTTSMETLGEFAHEPRKGLGSSQT